MHPKVMRAHLASLVAEFLRHSSETAVVSHRGNRSYRTSYGEVASLAGRFATDLQRRGVEPGERVLLWGANSAEWIGAFFGCLLRGVLVVPLDAAGATSFAERVLQEVSPRMVVGDRELLGRLESDLPRLALEEMNAALPAEPLFAVSDTVNAETPFQIVFTSGTTSEPKGIVHTHRNVLASLQPIENEIAKYRRYERWVHPLRFLHSLPLSHVFGQFMGLWVPPLLAAEVHFADSMEPARTVELIRHERISVLIAVPRVLHLMRAHLLNRFDGLERDLTEAKGLSILKRWWRFRRVHRAFGLKFWAVISGGAVLPEELELFWNRLGFALIQGYGMTETAALVTLNHPFHIGRGTIGKALPGREVRLSDEGEILVRGDMLSGATWREGKMHPREGEWLATGDLAATNDSGELRFLGRKGDVIVTAAGMNIHPADLESALNEQPAILSSVVVPCQTSAGMEPVAVVRVAGEESDLQTVVSQANRSLAEFQQIRRVLRWPELEFPYTSTGKLLRRKVAEWACGQIAGRGTDGSAHAGDSLTSLIAEVTGEPVSSSEEDLRLSEDLHLDSLGRVQLQSLLEQRLGVELEDDAMATMTTLGELRGAVAGREVRSSASGSLSKEGQGFGPVSAERSERSVAPQPEPTGDRVRSRPEEHNYPRWPWPSPVRVLRVIFVECILRPLVALLAVPRVSAAGRLPDGPLLVIGNHVTAYDAALILYALPRQLRTKMAIAMSGELIQDLRHGRGQGSWLANLLAPIGYWLITALFNVFPLPRLRGFRRSFAHAGEAMDRGYSVMVFPEGRRSQDGRLQPFRPGIGLLAQQSHVPVLPVALIGLGEIRTGQRRWFRSGHLGIRVGEVVRLGGDVNPERIAVLLEERLRTLLEPPL